MSIEDNSRDPADRNPSQREFALARQMEKDIREASVTGDALKYFLACDKWGVELPGDSLYDVGKDQYEAAQIIKQRKNLERELTSGDSPSEPIPEQIPTQRSGKDYAGFMERAKGVGLTPPVFQYVEGKLSALRHLGYRNLSAFGSFDEIDLDDVSVKVAIHHFYMGQLKKAQRELSGEE